MYIKLKKPAIYLIGVISIMGGYGQNVKNLSLDEAIGLCLANNKQLKVDYVKIQQSHEAVTESKEHRLPDFSVSGSYLFLTNPTIGGALGKMAQNSPDVNQASYVMATATLPLFAGLKVNNGIQAAKYLEEASSLDAENNKNAVVQNAINAYANVYKAQLAVNNLKENLKQAEQRTFDFKNLEKNGIVAKNDLLKVQLQESKVRLSLLDAQSSLKVANLNMNLMLGLADSVQLAIDTAAFLPVSSATSAAEYTQMALSNRNDLKAFQARQSALLSNIKVKKGDYFPSLVLTGGYVALNIPNLVSVTNAFNIGLGLKYSVSSIWKNGTKVQQAKLQLDELNANKAFLNDQVKLQVAQAYEAYDLSMKKIDLYNQALTQAEENDRIIKNKYKNSLVTTTELLEADLIHLVAKMDKSNAQTDALVAYRKLLQVSGSSNPTK